jgi:tripeptide aminopeptidase
MPCLKSKGPAPMTTIKFNYTVLERFLRYVRIDTQSDPESPTTPSTEKQKDLGRVLAQELRDLGIADAHLDPHGYVYATLPATTDKKVPVVCFCSHMDTSPDCGGKDVKPQIVRNYQGGDIVLPADSLQVIRFAEHPALAHQIGHDIVTTDGTTLLGADVAYTIDGESAGSIEDESFSADSATIHIQGVSAHPGMAKGKMEHAIKIAARIVDTLPQDTSTPETTEGREGFLHPVGIEGALEEATLHYIVRDFTVAGLKDKEALLERTVRDVMKDFPRSSYRIEVREQYRNMKEIVDQRPEIVEHAMEAIRRAGLKPERGSIRGGTDGSRLSFMGLPCPNIFAGEHAFHSRLEWVSVQDMEAAVRTIVHLAAIWEERA